MAEDVHLQGPGQRWPSGGQGDGVHLGLGEGEGAGLFGAGEEGSTSGSHVFPRSRRSTTRSSPIPPQLAREASRASGALELAYLTPPWLGAAWHSETEWMGVNKTPLPQCSLRPQRTKLAATGFHGQRIPGSEVQPLGPRQPLTAEGKSLRRADGGLHESFRFCPFCVLFKSTAGVSIPKETLGRAGDYRDTGRGCSPSSSSD